jgi:hypothetical protein
MISGCSVPALLQMSAFLFFSLFSSFPLSLFLFFFNEWIFTYYGNSSHIVLMCRKATIQTNLKEPFKQIERAISRIWFMYMMSQHNMYTTFRGHVTDMVHVHDAATQHVYSALYSYEAAPWIKHDHLIRFLRPCNTENVSYIDFCVRAILKMSAILHSLFLISLLKSFF